MRAEEWFPAFERNNIPIVLASSNYYAPYAGVVIRSLIDHASDENNYDIIIIERDISNPNKRILLQMAARRKNISLRFYNPSGFLARVDVSSLGTEKFPLELYYRVLAPYMLGCYERLHGRRGYACEAGYRAAVLDGPGGGVYWRCTGYFLAGLL